MHNGVRETLCEIRSEHWIAKGRQFVKKIIAKCTTCKRYEGGTYQIPPQPSLPDFRVSDDFAFTRIGVNFAGPVYAKPIFSKGVGRSAKANSKEGDKVCVYVEKTPRNLWRLGKVVKLFKGNDGQVRAVALRIWNKGKETITLQRPVRKVYPVEGSRIDETTSVPVRSNQNGGTALHEAAHSGSLPTVKLLVKHLPSLLNVKNRKGETPARIAAIQNQHSVLKYLYEVGVKPEDELIDEVLMKDIFDPPNHADVDTFIIVADEILKSSGREGLTKAIQIHTKWLRVERAAVHILNQYIYKDNDLYIYDFSPLK
ncbi:RNA-directed DNA polymerase from mobile element jockey, partial [Paramuricea clavata]